MDNKELILLSMKEVIHIYDYFNSKLDIIDTTYYFIVKHISKMIPELDSGKNEVLIHSLSDITTKITAFLSNLKKVRGQIDEKIGRGTGSEFDIKCDIGRYFNLTHSIIVGLDKIYYDKYKDPINTEIKKVGDYYYYNKNKPEFLVGMNGFIRCYDNFNKELEDLVGICTLICNNNSSKEVTIVKEFLHEVETKINIARKRIDEKIKGGKEEKPLQAVHKILLDNMSQIFPSKENKKEEKKIESLYIPKK